MLQSKAGYIDARPLTASSAKPLATHGRTIHWGQSRRLGGRRATSSLLSETDIIRGGWHVAMCQYRKYQTRSCRVGRSSGTILAFNPTERGDVWMRAHGM